MSKVGTKKMSGVERIAAERQRHFEVEGWTPEHDDAHVNGEMALAASVYAQFAAWPKGWRKFSRPSGWPWERKWWKPKDPIRDLEKAGALIAAEIDRLLRAEESPR